MAWARVTGATLGAQTGTNPGAGSVTWAPGSLGAAVALNQKIIASVSVWNVGGTPVVGSITDSLGNTYIKDLSVTSIDGSGNLEFSIWSALVTVAGTPALTLHLSGLGGGGSGTFGIGIAAGAYSGLSVSSGAAGIDISKQSTGTGATADSGTTVTTTSAANELKVGLYQDDGWNTTLTVGILDTTYSFFQKIDANINGQAAVEDVDAGVSGSTARAEVGTATASAVWGMGVVVYKLAASRSFIPCFTRPFPFSPGSPNRR